MRNLKRPCWLLLAFFLAACAPGDQSQPQLPGTTLLPTITRPEISPTDTDTPPATATEETAPTGEPNYTAQRLALVTNSIIPYGIEDPDVIRAMGIVPRHLFVPEEYAGYAYLDFPLPIGYGQTISQPFMVAWMTDLLELQEGDKVLEIGTGSGYQAAVLAEIGYVEVYSIEIVPELAEQGKQNLASAGYEGVNLKQDDGYYGWEEHAPFDAIIVTAAPDHLPQPLVEQLSEGGYMVIPIGPPGWYQTLWRVTIVEGEVMAQNLGPVAFVPFTGEGAASQELQPGNE